MSFPDAGEPRRPDASGVTSMEPSKAVPSVSAESTESADDCPTLDPVEQARVRAAAACNAKAAAIYESGDYAYAVPLFERAWASCRSVLGKDHPYTLTVAGNLGVAQFAAGDRRRGLKRIVSTFSARARVLGDDHPATLVAQNALAAAHRLAGDADNAVALAKQVVLQRTRVLGSTHSDTLYSRMGLALAFVSAGEISSALRMLASAINDAENVFGREHIVTLTLLESARDHGLVREET